MEDLDRDEILKQKYLARGPGDAATKAYIASKYLSNDDSTKKKKKKKSSTRPKNIGNIGIIDEEDVEWKTAPEEENKLKRVKVEQEELEKEAIANAGGVFLGTTSNWQTIREGEQVESDEEPVIVNQEPNDVPRMSNGQRAGILTKAEIKVEAERAREAEKKALAKLKKESQGENTETIYRDNSGRKIDPKILRAEEARLRKEEIEKAAKRMEWGKGLVQRKEAEEEKRRLKEEKDKPMARYADDEDLNEELKEVERWNDPAAGFLTKKTSKSKTTRQTRPKYKGAWKPNRFMIAPGYRWDGVDRSTGFEDTFLLQQNQSKSRAVEAHAWAVEDM